MIRKIAITGPESTGKSVLSEQLAKHYHTCWVPEYAREYLRQINRPYEEKDLVDIAKGQLKSEGNKQEMASDYLFCDTELIVIKIWSEVKYGRCHPWISEALASHAYDLYLLCDIDLPWQFDPLREHPNDRKFLFNLYFNELKNRNLPFLIVKGIGDDRLNSVVEKIDTFIFAK
ncbi:MAG: ATP-binding protein [Bacteroidales bacterium]|nr:ATP-binding protein [Bacteroidales bacterium]MDD4602798.1 ATP-binding protein [Bacteroidales bacterium]